MCPALGEGIILAHRKTAYAVRWLYQTNKRLRKFYRTNPFSGLCKIEYFYRSVY